jgi:hypothetical protein
VVDYCGIVFWGYGYNWAILGLEEWSMVAASIIGFFVLLELLLYLGFLKTKKIVTKTKKKRGPEFIDGKKVYTYTYPKGVEGGIYSKTYIDIDGRNILRLRSMMIPPGELWGGKSEKDIE